MLIFKHYEHIQHSSDASCDTHCSSVRGALGCGPVHSYREKDMLTGLLDATIRFFGGFDERDPWYGSTGTFAKFFRKEFEEVAMMCGWRTQGASAHYNMATNCVEIRTDGGETLATIRVHGVLDNPESAVVYVQSLIEPEREALRRRLPIPITFTGNVS